MTDILIRHLTIVTVDAARRVLEDSAIAITDDRIVAIGSDADLAAVHADAVKVIDGRGMVAMPGLIDSHAHAGHSLIRSLGAGNGQAWFDACAEIYARASTVDFWRAEAQLAQLERLMSGVTTSLTLLGGGADVYRTDDPAFGDAHCEVTAATGLRTMLAVGPGRAPFPQKYRRIHDGRAQDTDLTFDRQLEVSEALIRKWNDFRDHRTGICLIMPVYNAGDMSDPAQATEIRHMSGRVAEMRAKHGVLFTQDGHRNGSVAIARDLGLLGPNALLSHSVDLTPEDIAALKATGAHVVHNPSAIMSVYGRCPAPELIDAGVTVCIGSDAGAPDRGFDMFRHMAQCMHYHRRHFRDPSVMPPGKVLEMVTIDAAKALGMDDILGSIEVGKKADIVLVDMRKPHLYPPNMPVTRLAHFANAADVDTVIVDGRILMEKRNPVCVDPDEILDFAAAETARTLQRSGLSSLTAEPSDYWGSGKRNAGPYPVRN